MEEKTIVLSPSGKKDVASGHSYADVLITLLAVTVMPVYLYGIQVVWLMLAALLTAIVLEWVCMKLLRRKMDRRDISGMITAIITVLLMPASVPVWVPCVSVGIAICVAKYPFGGTGKNIFNPAAVGVAFCAFCWPEYVLKYPIPFTMGWGMDPSAVQYDASPASILRLGGTPKIDYVDVLLGKFPGPMGVTCMIVLAACLLYLLLRRKISAHVTLSAMVVVFLAAVFFPRTSSGEMASLIFEFCSGAFVFGVIFMANDPATRPKTNLGCLFFGLLTGLLTVILRRFGSIELSFVYAILLANIFVTTCDKNAVWIISRLKQRALRREEAEEQKAGEQA